ncbi:alpha/beta hydrolase [Rhodocyclus tenuis]|uniref:Serine aminopeptidase S33 domain-containing protein n=1 Tax=Rhodocyclus tenuis TaxID=1066 RepID=A0A840G328_RHOTE|nr:alpha/beta fold hydrolase [Rhodocyclus tenuis]MBB4248807.1 hypothetical protein [Rhodocyclus tenuis]
MGGFDLPSVAGQERLFSPVSRSGQSAVLRVCYWRYFVWGSVKIQPSPVDSPLPSKEPMKLGCFACVALLIAVSTCHANPVDAVLEARGPSGPLNGTMLSASTYSGSVVLIISGSGPIDRDGNSPSGIKASTYRLLAESLADQGISTVRVDKRGMFASAAAAADPNAVTISDYAADVHSWVESIRSRTGTSCVWLLGHSEGALVTLVAAKNPSRLCGLVLIAAPGRPIGEVLREQLKSNPANASLLDQAFAAIEALEAGKHVDTRTMSPALLPLFRPQVQDFLIDEFAYDPAELLANTTLPVLIIHGKRDLQVGEHDAFRLKGANAKAELSLLNNTNHVLKVVTSDDRRINISTYTDPNLPLAPSVADTIVRFIKAVPSDR